MLKLFKRDYGSHESLSSDPDSRPELGTDLCFFCPSEEKLQTKDSSENGLERPCDSSYF